MTLFFMDKHTAKTLHVLVTTPYSGNTGRTGIVKVISTEILKKFCHVRGIHIAITVKVTIAGTEISTLVEELVSSEINQE